MVKFVEIFFIHLQNFNNKIFSELGKRNLWRKTFLKDKGITNLHAKDIENQSCGPKFCLMGEIDIIEHFIGQVDCIEEVSIGVVLNRFSFESILTKRLTKLTQLTRSLALRIDIFKNIKDEIFFDNS